MRGGAGFDLRLGRLRRRRQRVPPRAKMTLVSWLGIFPLVYLYAELFNRILPSGAPGILKVFAITALVVPTMSYVVAPRLTRLFKDWLYPKPTL